MNKRNQFRFILMACSISLGAAISYSFFPRSCAITTHNTDSSISEYEPSRDRADILRMFTIDKYWLISSPDYSPEHALDTRSPNKREPQYFGKLQIRVMRENGEFVGFVAFYLKSFYEGFVLFLSVDEKHRRKGAAAQLMEHALQTLQQQGAHVVRLCTRISNIRAQNLYNKLGFTEVARDDGFVFFWKSLNS